MIKRVFYLLALMAILSVALVACGGGGSEGQPAPSRGTPTSPSVATTPATAPSSGSLEVALQDQGGKYAFSPSSFTFKVGQKVRLRLRSQNEFHTFTASDVPTQEGKKVDFIVNGGQTVDFEFTPSRVGSYKLTCLPHDALGMKGTITVTQ